ncbi:MAG TPA: MlaD family protein [Solirubrobacterales bacterium]|nr:MlaD family protein [Solirubrobacterales bacterium]
MSAEPVQGRGSSRAERDRGASRARRDHRLPSWAIGLALVVVVAIGSVLAYTKQLPFGDGYEVRAVFTTAQNIRTGAPVRIAGIEVGEVTGVEHLTTAEEAFTAEAGGGPPEGGPQAEEAAVVTMRISDSGRPVRTDATLKLRPRLFLEGNLFVDLSPGSPSAPEAEEGFTFPVSQTAVSVELDQILSTLQADVRRDLQTFLDQFGNALVEHGGAEGFRELYRTSPPAFKYTAQVNEALLGTEHGDLRGVLRGFSRVFRGLARNERTLAELVTNFRVSSGSFARQDAALATAIEELPRVIAASEPAYDALNASFPPLRAFAREALPGVRSTPETVAAATPFVDQLRLLVSERELRGLARDLRPTIPRLARLTRETERFLHQSRALSSCFNEVVIRWANDTVDPQTHPGGEYPHEPTGRVFETTGYGLSGIAGENRSGDANANYLRVHGSGGLNTIQMPDVLGLGHDLVGLTQFELLGAMPRIGDSAKTDFRPDVRCETQDPPDLGGGLGSLPFEQQQVAPPTSVDTSGLTPEQRRLDRRLVEISSELADAGGADAPPEALQRARRRLEALLSPDLAGAGISAGDRDGGGER